MHIKKIVNGQEIILKDTTKLQLASLTNFAKELGYVLQKGTFTLRTRKLKTKQEMAFARVSFQTMQQWHNNATIVHDTVVDFYLRRYDVEGKPLPLDRLLFSIAQSRKLVKKTKMQYSKKKDEYIVVDHQIEFV